MNYKEFERLYLDAMDCNSAEQLIAEEGGSVDCDDAEKVISDLRIIWEIANNGIIAARHLLGMTQREFSRNYGIPKRSVENWEQGKRTSTDYAMRMLMYAIYSDISANG